MNYVFFVSRQGEPARMRRFPAVGDWRWGSPRCGDWHRKGAKLDAHCRLNNSNPPLLPFYNLCSIGTDGLVS